MPVDIGSLEFYTGPETLGGPDNLNDTIIQFIEDAEERLDAAVQELDDLNIAGAFVRAAQRGVKLRIILERDYLIAPKPPEDVFQPGGRYEENRQILGVLYRAGAEVYADLNPGIFHQKFMIRDRKTLLTGSTNFTTTGISRNLNHLIIINNRYIIKQYIDEFGEMLKGRFGGQSSGDFKAPRRYKVSSVPVKALFAPEHGPEMEIMKQMMKARQSIHFAIFTFAQSSGIDDTMQVLCRAGIRIRGAMDGRQANQDWAATHPIHEAGVELFTVNPQSNLGKLHHKLMVIDDQVVIAGSFNYTGPANYINDENLLVIGDLGERDPEVQDRQRQIATYAINEIERIIQHFGRAM